jgi:uncharacterized membrane protein
MVIGTQIVADGETDITNIHFAFPYWTDARFADIGDLGEGEVVWAFPGASVNSPLCYVPYSIGYLIAKLLSASPVFAVIMMRLFGVATYGLLIRFAIKNAPFGKIVLLFVAILPNCIAVNSMISADMLTTAFTFVFFSYVLRFLFYYKELTRKDFIGLGISLCSLALFKMPYIAFGLVLFLIFAVNRLWEHKKEMAKIALIGFSALVFFLLWACVISGINTYTVWGISGIDSQAQLVYILKNPLHVTRMAFSNIIKSDMGLFSTMAYCAKGFPTWLVLICAVCAFSVDVCSCPKLKMKNSVAIFLLCVVIFIALIINFALYLTFTPVGDWQISGVQSRYYIPLLVPLFISVLLICSSGLQHLANEPTIGKNARVVLPTNEKSADGRSDVAALTNVVSTDVSDVLAEIDSKACIIKAPVAVFLVPFFVFALRVFSVWLPH